MKRFLYTVVIILAGIALIDFIFGLSCKYLNSHALGGDTRNHYYIATECDADVLVFGSSRALHHYVPEIISDTLRRSVYNCGLDGNGIVFLYARLLMMTNRYTPKAIIYDLSEYDFKQDDDTKYLKCLRRFYDLDPIPAVFERIAPLEKYKMLSNLYRYNSHFTQLLMDNLHPMQEITDCGYKPLYGTMQYEPGANRQTEDQTTWDPIKKEFMSDFVQLCKSKGICLLFVSSPAYNNTGFKYSSMFQQFAASNNVIFIDHYQHPGISSNKDYFKDSSHLNDEGARAFTMEFAGEIGLQLN